MMLEPDYEPGKDPVIDGLVKREQGRTAFKGAVTQGVRMNPDEYAKAVKLSLSTGVVPDVVLKDMKGFEQEAQVNALAGLQDTHPKTAAFLTQNAELAHDDADTLKRMEDVIPSFSAAPDPTWKDKMNSFWRHAMEGTLFSSPEEAQAIRQAESARVRAARSMGQNPMEFHTGNATNLPASRIAVGAVRGALRPVSGLIRYSERKTGLDTGAGDLTKQWVEALTPANPTLADTSVENFSSTLGLMVPGMAVGKGVGLLTKIPSIAKVPGVIKTLGPWASAMAMAVPEAASEAEDAYDNNLARGMKKEEANRIADRVFWGNVALLTVTDKIAWFSRGGMGRAALSEAIQEGGQQIMGNRATGRPTFEGVPESAAMGAGVATAIPILGGLAGGMFKTRNMGATHVQDYSQTFFDALADGAQNSKLLARLPEKYQEAVQSMVKDGPVEHLRMNPEAFETFYQSKGVDPAAKAAELGVKNYMEAKLSGNDLLIPTAAYATQVAGTEDHAELSKDLRLVEGTLTAREREAAMQGGERLAAMAQEVDSETQSRPEFQAIKEELKARYMAAGETAAVAETYAMDGAKVFQNMARQAGMNPSELFAQYAPKIVRGDAPSPVDVIQEAFTPETFPAEGVSWADQESMYWQSAYHGSPYRFDKFSLEHMGKGEGAQAYGWGLYFAGNKEVAEYYRETLASSVKIRDMQFHADGTPNRVAQAAFQMDSGISNEDVIDGLESLGHSNEEARQIVRDAQKLFDDLDKGQTYQVDIPDDGAYLLWDKPLSEQPETVKKALAEIDPDQFSPDGPDYDPNEQGQIAYRRITEPSYSIKTDFGWVGSEAKTYEEALAKVGGVASRVKEVRNWNDKAASLILKEHGIAGIKYLDGSSRGAGEGNYNYVVFDDNAVKITKTFYQSMKAPGGSYGSVKSIPLGTSYDTLSFNDKQDVTASIEKDIDTFYDNQAQFFEAYDKEEGTYGGQLVNADIVYGMLPTVKANLHLGWTASGEVDLGRITNLGMLAKELQTRAIDRAGDLPVVVTAGGQAAGKTSLAERFLDPEVQTAGAVIDAPNDDAKTVEKIVRKILAAGKDAAIAFVERPDFGASEISNIKRAIKQGRYVEAKWRSATTAKVAPEMVKAGEIFRNQPRVQLHHFTNIEREGFSGVGGPLDGDGKDAMVSIKNVSVPSESELVNIAREAYISFRDGNSDDRKRLTPELQAHIEKSLGIYQEPGVQQGYEGTDQQAGNGTVEGVQRPTSYFQSRPMDERSFGSKQWNEYYRSQVGKNARAKGDRAKRAEAGMKAANSEQGQAAFDFERNQEAKAEQEAFLNFDRAMSRVVQPRGWFSRGADGSFVIGKTPEGDFSTFIHEPAHAYLEMFSDLYQREGASERLKEDGAKILKFLEVDSFDKITTLEHEKWARANEAYAREGKAPSEELRPVFQRFKVWLQSVYRYVSELDVELNDDIRGVFDRMRATDQEIELAHQEVAGPQLFTSAEEAGWTDKEFKAYAIEKDMSIEEAKAEVLAKMNEAALREKTQEWKREESEIREAVTAMVDERPEFRAIRTLRKGVMEDGTPLTLNREALVAQFGEDRVKGLQAQHINLYRKEGGVDAQTAAELLGFESGDVLMEALESTGKRKDAIAEATRAVMTQNHGDIRYDGTLTDQARQAVANDARSRSLHRELSALRNKVNKAAEAKADAKAARAAVVIPPVQTFREAAISIVEAKPIMDLDANSYLNGQRKYSREAFKLNGQGKFQEAADAKQKELLNHFLYLESVKAKAESEKIAAYGKRLAGTPAQERIGKAHGGYLEQINAMLERFDFAKMTNKAIREVQTLAQFAEGVEKAGNGESLAIEPQLLDERYQKNYREMNIAELRAVKDALKNIETLARLENEYLADGRRETYEQIRKMFMEWTPENEKGVIHREGDKLTLSEKGGHLVRGIDAEWLKVEWMVDRFDRGDINGPMRTFIKKTIDNANGRKLDLGFEIFGKIKALADARPREEVAREMDLTGIKFPSQPQEMTQQQLISWAFNLGTIENRNVALGGEGLILPDGSISPLVDKAMSKLSSSQWEFIQGVWDIMETLRPMIAEKQKRTTGVEPKWKENAPFSVMTSDGKTVQLRGGYYPLAADSKTTDIGKNQSDPLAVNGQGSRSRPTVASGFTKEVTGATYNLKLDYPSVLSSHLNDVITNLTCGEAVAAVNKVISDPDIRRAMEEKLGPEYVATLKPWLVDFLERASDVQRSGAIADFITRFKSGATVATLAGNAASILVQGSDIAKPLFAPGISNLELVKARIDMTRHGKELVDQIKELSPNVMRHRAETFNREIKDTLQSWNMFEQKKRSTTQFLMSAFAVVDAQMTFPTWLAVYRKGLKTHGIESQAITEADAVINRTFQAGDAANMSAMFRSRNAWMRLFTTFQNDGNTWYGIISSSVASKKIGRISMALMGAFVGQALGQILKGRGPGDDDDKREWAMKQALLVPVGSMPFFGDVISTALSLKGYGGGGDFTSSMMGRSTKAFAQPFVHWDDMDWQDIAITEADALGTWLGIPGTTQALRSWKYVHKVQTGKEQPNSNAEAVKNLVLGPPPKKK